MDESKTTESKIAKDGKKVTEPTYSVTEIIKGFEERLLELGAQLDHARDLAYRMKRDKEQAESQLRNRPFRDLGELSTEKLLDEVERRITRDRNDD